jgi:hypothetical protein
VHRPPLSRPPNLLCLGLGFTDGFLQHRFSLSLGCLLRLAASRRSFYLCLLDTGGGLPTCRFDLVGHFLLFGTDRL